MDYEKEKISDAKTIEHKAVGRKEIKQFCKMNKQKKWNWTRKEYTKKGINNFKLTFIEVKAIFVGGHCRGYNGKNSQRTY